MKGDCPGNKTVVGIVLVAVQRQIYDASSMESEVRSSTIIHLSKPQALFPRTKPWVSISHHRLGKPCRTRYGDTDTGWGNRVLHHTEILKAVITHVCSTSININEQKKKARIDGVSPMTSGVPWANVSY